MRIISDFNDYYDIGVSYGVDPNIVYERKERELTEKEVKQLFNFPEYERLRFRDVVNKIVGKEVGRLFQQFRFLEIVGFCGKWYFTWWDTERESPGCFPSGPLVTKYHWYWSDALEDKINKDRYTHKEDVSAIKELMRSSPYEGMDLFVTLGVPSIHIFSNGCNEIKITTNPILKNLSFASVVDPWTAFQEVDMFVSGILGQPQPNTVDVNDETLRDAKGFDNMSFKKPKTKKRG